MRPLLLAACALTAAALSSAASAQARGGGTFGHPPGVPQVTPGFAGFGVPQPAGIPSIFHRRPFGGGSVFFYSDLGYEPVTPQPVSVVVVQPSAPAPAAQVDEQRPAVKPLLLELQGDRWVQVDRFQGTGSPVQFSREPASVRPAPKPPLPTLLVFRDGRAEATSGYAIIGDALYAQTDYWTTGAWTRKIALAELDLSATMRANRERGVSFKLPSGPNEVVLHP
jgi:hypothetical protein